MPLLMTGCARSLRVIVKGSTDLNNGGHAIVLRLYQLRNDANFLNATIESFWQDDAGVLGDDLVERMELTLHPGETVQVRIKRAKGARFIGAAADFYNPDRDRWRQAFPLPSGRGKDVWVTLGPYHLVVVER
jgi:type VI secretion system VasD/TssJ family lipoprotein